MPCASFTVTTPALSALSTRHRTWMSATNSPAPLREVPRTRRVAGIGLVCVDLVATVSAFPAPDAKIRSTSFAEHGGGNAANAVVAARRLGAASALVSVVGSDARGTAARDSLAADGVDVSHIRAVPGARTPFSIIIADASAGTRACIHTPDPRCALHTLDEAAARAVKAADVLLIDGRYADAAIEAARAARAAGKFVLVDAERVREGTETLVALAHGVVVKDACAAALASANDDGDADSVANLVKLLDRGPMWAVATRGAKGSVAVRRLEGPVEDGEEEEVVAGLRVRRRAVEGSRTELLECEAVEGVKVVDGTGAGDAFIGALAYAVAARLPLHRALALAAVAGAECCKGSGARASPSREDIANVIREVEEDCE